MRSVAKASARLPLARFAGAFLLLAPVGLTGCSIFTPIPTPRGQMVEKQDYDTLVPGTTTRADVTALLGSPTSRATFDDNTWFYIGEVTAPVPLSRPRVNQQQVLVLNFDQGGVLRQLRRLDKSQAHNVAMVGRVTPSPGSDASFMQQLIGNVGRYNPMGLGGDTLGGSSGLGSNNGYGHGGAGNTLP
ncbi:outer membrane protein assembly factor BamE [Lichenicola cladoniae]|uniref:Outer membrane protein assembly factor BamE n=1 Tax=Lichenicola cladoniae TaxID=1484109 RepID=A0A6M8HQK3_9PROT|nr:outer membrane protein assembly factor BamE [Lichenicola cladoniae]NPD67977.1 outer membrane protein assembly factor BamE [Acetobacteraceae bacterium]QKE90567.1 outer membrane protein assembly factor BamE [Lichenicola cladoniae]